MIITESKIAKKYASAFLNVYGKHFSPSLVEKLGAFKNFVTTNHLYQTTLNIPSLPKKTKKLIIDHVSTKLSLPDFVTLLVVLLLKDKRIDLLGEILKKILFLHDQRESKHHFVVASSHELSEQERNKVISFIKLQIENKVKTSFAIDKSLISGIRITGNTLRWERSIAKQLRDTEQKLLCREEL